MTDFDKKTKRYLRLRSLAIAAFCITLLFTVFILIESLLPGDVSAKQSAFFAGIISKISSNGAASAFTSTLNSAALFPNPKTNPHLFTRKFLGHFSCFFVYGIFLSSAVILLAKHKFMSPLYSSAAGVLTAFLSELFQLPLFTSGRDANLKDVGIDCLGLLSGVATVSIIALIIYLALSKKHKADIFKRINFHTVFVKKDIGIKLVFFDEN